jgi:hypothetical protein
MDQGSGGLEMAKVTFLEGPNPYQIRSISCNVQLSTLSLWLNLQLTKVSKIRPGLPISSLEWGTICAF